RPRLALSVAVLGVLCLLSLPLFALGRALWGALAPESWGPGLAATTKLVIVLAVIFPPTFLIGVTLPLFTELYARISRRLGASVSLVYGLDTLGGASGALLAGLVLVPHVGLRGSTWLLGTGALALAAGLWRLQEPDVQTVAAAAAPSQAPKKRGRAKPAPRREEVRLSPAMRRLTLGAFALSGCAAMWLETGWNRFFYLLNGTSVASLAFVLAGFLGGIGLGSLLTRRRADSLRNLSSVIAYLQIAIAIAGIFVFRARETFEHAYLSWFQSTAEESAFFLQVFLLIFGLVLLATLAMGANFPLVTRLLAQQEGETEGAGAALGRAYFANTLGAVAGALTSEYLLLPWLGFAGLIVATVVAYLLTAAVFVAQAPLGGRRRQLATAGVLAAVALVLSPLVLPFEPPKSAVYYHGVRDGTWELYQQANSEMTTVYRRQGYYGQVSVLSIPEVGALFLKHNGKTDATNLPGDNYAQLLMGHLPMMLHPDPRRVLNIGLGGGLTLAAVLRHPEAGEVVQVEIDPLVAAAARLHFRDANHAALEDPRVRMVFDDGRNYVDRARRRFDVIVSEPPNIWVAGVSGLFTREFYAAARRHLAPGGLLSQWLPVHEMSAVDFRTALRTLSLEFPYSAVWTNGYDAIVLAAVAPLPTDLGRVAARARAPGVEEDFAGIGVSLPQLPEMVAHPRFRGAETLRVAPGRELNTDDRPVLEFRSARNLYRFAKHPEQRWLNR
ncbi:MAG TPA: fused MFS/spermidine synthase, partial [Thermoanaerobaculia bacterium]|nr:fused MFS/spermidine synthase [Thermoanaerobaculia bacterium]